jgi:hypothetical protein
LYGDDDQQTNYGSYNGNGLRNFKASVTSLKLCYKLLRSLVVVLV